MIRKLVALIALCCITIILSACHANQATGNPKAAGIGAGIGAGGAALLGAPNAVIAMSGLSGGVVGYYVTTLKFQSQGIRRVGGKVYQVGDRLAIYIPSDYLFEPNTAEFVPQANSILDSAVTVLNRKPNNNIMISGNTSGFYLSKWEQKLSQERAEKISAYLWGAGINQFKHRDNHQRKLDYVGYGDYFPIASTLTNKGIRANSRIQITSYPSDQDLCLDKKHLAMINNGGSTPKFKDAPASKECYKGCC